MAEFQSSYKWMTVFLFILATAAAQCVSACHTSSKELHICLNIYLERDFPLIETIVNGQQSDKLGRRRVILEGPDLDSFCNHILSLYNCYWGLLPECDTLWQYDRYMRVMDVLNATRNHLCSGNKINIRDLLLNSGCLARARAFIAECKGFDWKMTWRRVLRMQLSPSEGCEELETYGECLKDRLKNIACGPQAFNTFQKLINVWLQHWCGKDLTPEEEKVYFYITEAKGKEALNETLQELEKRMELNMLEV